MPKTLFDAEGKEVLVPDETELAQMKADAQAATDAKAKLESYEKDDKYQNVRKLAESRDRLAESLKKLGKNVDVESGNVTDQPTAASTDEARSIARQTSEQFFIDQAVENAKASLDENDRKIFDKMFPKASHGEEVNSKTIAGIIAQTKAMSGFSEAVEPRRAPQRNVFQGRFGGVPEAAQGEAKPLSPLQADFVHRTGMQINPRKRA